MEKQYEIRVYGRVQGVGFRYSVQTMARSLGLKGWVGNQPDGTVLTVIQGKAEDCHTFIQWCRTGPGYSWVEHLEISEKTPGPLQSFQIR